MNVQKSGTYVNRERSTCFAKTRAPDLWLLGLGLNGVGAERQETWSYRWLVYQLSLMLGWVAVAISLSNLTPWMSLGKGECPCNALLPEHV
jgi:hypothetical protein